MICLYIIGEGEPAQLAGPFLALQRQILLPVVFSFNNGDCYKSLSFIQQWDIALANFSASVFRVTCEGCKPYFLHLAGCSSDGWCRLHLSCVGRSQYQERSFWVHQFRGSLERLIDEGLAIFSAFLFAALVELGNGAMTCFRTGCLLTFCYLCRLLLFGWNLKGGVYNWDNLLRLMRSTVMAAPWQLAVGLNAFSPRLSSGTAGRGGKRRALLGHSMDLFFLLILVATFLGPVAAANDRRPPAHPPEFPRAPVSQDGQEGDQGLLGDPDIARELVTNLVAVQAPPEVYVYRAFKLFGFGRQPEYISSANVRTTSSQRCLELLEPDADVSSTGGRGALHYLKGPAVIDELQAQWIPSWVHSALGRIIVIDASLLGYTPFQAYIRDGIVSYARINSIMPELVDREYYIFVPSHDADPLAYEGYPSRMIIDHGDVIHLTPDPAPPQAVHDVRWAFDHFPDWSLTEFADGYDTPNGHTHVMVLSDRDNFLIEALVGETDLALTRRICNEMGIDSSGASLVRSSEPFDRPMYYQHFLSDIVFLLETPLVDDELVVFVDARPVLQTFSAVRLAHPVIPVGEATGLFNIQVEAVEGYRLWLKGGRRQRDSLVAEHRDTFWLKLEPQEFEYTSSDSQDETSGGPDDDGEGGSDTSSPGAPDEDALVDSYDEADGLTHPEPVEAAHTGASANYRYVDGGVWEQGWTETTKWNCAFDYDAFAQGGHGDTSGCVSAGCSSSDALPTSLAEVTTPGCAPLTPRLTRSRHKLGETAWSLFATLLVAHIVPNDAAILPIANENTGWSGRANLVPGDHRDGQEFCSELGWTTCTPSRCFSFFAEPSGDRQISLVDYLDDCSTLLECAKGHDFYRTCQELAWFVDHLTLQASSESPVSCPGVVIRLEHVLSQCQEPTGSNSPHDNANGSIRRLLSASQDAHKANRSQHSVLCRPMSTVAGNFFRAAGLGPYPCECPCGFEFAAR